LYENDQMTVLLLKVPFGLTFNARNHILKIWYLNVVLDQFGPNMFLTEMVSRFSLAPLEMAWPVLPSPVVHAHT